MWAVIKMWFMPKKKLSCHDWSNRVQYVMKTRQDNSVIDYTSAVYVKNETELLWQIGLHVFCDEN